MTTDLRDELQTALGDAYRLERELGGGGMSRVFLATESALGRDVVIKVLPPTMAGAISLERFRREIQLAARLQHAHIVPLLSAGDANGTPYYTMPFVRGETLRERLARVGELPVADAVKILRDVASALATAHRAGIVHRDIKPENVLLAEHDAMVADFGVSKAVTAAAHEAGSGLTSAGVALGTPAYMAPEQAAADPQADHRVDVYALGLLGYEMLAGSAPFAGRTPQATIAAHVAETPEPLAKRRPAVPPALAALVMRCLEKRPADRPQSADEIVRALDAAATTSALAPEPSSARANRQTLGIVTLVAALALAALGGWFAWRLRRPPALVEHTAVAVLPFRITGGDASLRMMREGIPDLVAAKLTGRIHAVDVRTVLAAWRRAGGSESVDLSSDDALALGRRLGAGVVLQGDAVVTGRALVLTGTLLRVDGHRSQRATARGAVDSLPALLDSVVSKLLVLDAGESDERAIALAGVPLEALQSYLAGRAFDRAGHYKDAVEAYGRALDADSTFALAALRLWITGENWFATPRVPAAAAIATHHADRLGARDRLLLGVLDRSRPRTCAEQMRVEERAVAEAPDMPDLWYLLGESLTHCAPATDMENSQQRAINAFDRALALDSTYAGAYEHLPVLYASLGDTAMANRSLAILLRSDSTGDLRGPMALFSADSATRQRARAAVERAPATTQAVVFAGALFFNDAAELPFVERLLTRMRRDAATNADRVRVENLTRVVALSRGQPRRAAAAVRANPNGVNPAVALLDATFWDGDTTLALAALDSARAIVVAARGDSAGNAERTTAAFALGTFAAARGDTSEARHMMVALRSVDAPASAPWQNARAQRLALLLDAQLAALARRADAGRLLAGADSMLREAPGGAYVEGAGNLIVAALWERAGDVSKAAAATYRYRRGAAVPFALSTYLREAARLTALAGDRERAIALYRHYLGLRAAAEPSFAKHLASVRAELAKLEQASAGR